MLQTLAIAGYRSLKDVRLPLSRLNLVTGPNGSGKSSLYRSLRLLSETAQGGLIRSLAQEGGLQSTLWAGPEIITNELRLGQTPLQGTLRKKPVHLRLGFTSDDLSYTIELGLPAPSETSFALDPVIKRECLWQGSAMKGAALRADRRGNTLRCRDIHNKWQNIDVLLTNYTSMLTEFASPTDAAEIVVMRDTIRTWRFYDYFRSDIQAPARRSEVATYTPVLADDGSDLASALKTIQAFGDGGALATTIDDAFPGSILQMRSSDTRIDVTLEQPGMLRPLAAAELSDGTLRYLLLAAALLSPRPPSLMVLNEPETSLHPDVLPALGRLIAHYAQDNQVIVVTHADALVKILAEEPDCARFELEKSFGATEFVGLDPFSIPHWKWPAR